MKILTDPSYPNCYMDVVGFSAEKYPFHPGDSIAEVLTNETDTLQKVREEAEKKVGKLLDILGLVDCGCTDFGRTHLYAVWMGNPADDLSAWEIINERRGYE